MTSFPAIIEYRLKDRFYPAAVEGVVPDTFSDYFIFDLGKGYAFLNPIPTTYRESLEEAGEFEKELSFDEALETLILAEEARKAIQEHPEIQRLLAKIREKGAVSKKLEKMKFRDWKKNR